MTDTNTHRDCAHEAENFERLGEERKDTALIERLTASPEALHVPVWREMVLVRENDIPCPVLLSRDQTGQLLPGALDGEPMLLGWWRGQAVLAVDVPADDASVPDRAAPVGCFRELRSLFPLIASDELRLLGYAKSMLHWRRVTRFCGACGSPTVPDEGGHVRRCPNPACRASHFPRTDPAVIMLITRGEEALFVRQPIWPKGMYALVSGFVEQGETLEEAAAREALEETALTVGNIRYFGSKPWPFPGTIMLAFTAEALSGELVLDHGELEDGFFLTRRGLKDAIEAGAMRLPSKHSLAFPLIEQWYDAGDLGPLRPLNDF